MGQGEGVKLFILLLIYPVSAFAVFQQIYERYKTSDYLKEILIQEKIIEQDYQLGINKYEWDLGIQAGAGDSFLASLYSFQTQKTLSQAYGLNLTRSSFGAGTLSLSHSQTRYDLTHWANNNLASMDSDVFFESRNSITYTYELLNQAQELDWTKVVAQNELDKANYNIAIQQAYYEFFMTYITAKAQTLLDRLYKEAEKDAGKRVSVMNRRLRDGLGRKYELMQARLSLLSQKETTIRNFNDLNESVKIIENIIGIKFTEEDFNKIYWTTKKKSDFNFVLSPNNFIELDKVKKTSELSEVNLRQYQETLSQQLSFSIGYTKNSMNPNANTAIEKSFGNSKYDEKVISLNYSIPLGTGKTDAQKRKLLLQRNQNNLREKNKKSELKVQAESLQESIDKYVEALGLAKQKIKAAESSLKEHQKLYPRGQVSFEEMINSEQMLINAKISQTNMLLLYEQSLAKLAFMSGKMIPFLNQYQD